MVRAHDRFPKRCYGRSVVVGLFVLLLTSGCQKGAKSLSQLNATNIPAELRFPGQPPEVVGVLTPKAESIGLTGIAFSPDGTLLAGGYGGGNVVVWHTGTLEELSSTKAHNNVPISAVLFSPDGKSLITSSYDKTVRLWDINNRGRLHLRSTLDNHTDQVWGMSLSPDGKTLASASTDKSVRTWNVDAAREIGVIDNREMAWSVSIAADGRTLACTNKNDIALWDIGGETPQRLANLTGHTDTVWRVAFAATGNILASCGRDQSVRLWDVDGEKSTECAILKGHGSKEIYGLAMSPNGKRLVSADLDGEVFLWDVDNGTKREQWKLPNGLRAAAFAPDNRHVAISCNDKRVYLLRLPE